MIVFDFQTNNLKSTNFWSKGGLQQNGVLWSCVLQNIKSYRFLGGPFFGQIVGDAQKNL